MPLRKKSNKKKEKKNRDESQASSMSQDFGRGADNTEDVDLVQFNIDEPADDEADALFFVFHKSTFRAEAARCFIFLGFEAENVLKIFLYTN